MRQRPLSAHRLTRCAALACLLLAPLPPAAAHSLHLTAHAEGGALQGRASYSDQSPAAGVLVEVRDPADDRPLTEGLSDADGRFRLPVAPRPLYRVSAEDDEGHRVQVDAQAVGVQSGNADALRLLREDIARLEQRIHLQDVLGGIGYLVGLAGLMAWWQARRRA